MTEQKKEVLIIIIGIVVLFGVIAGTVLYHRSQFTEPPVPADYKFDVGDEIVFTGGASKGHHAVVLDKDDYHSWPGGWGMASSGKAYLLKFDNGEEKWLSQFLADGYAEKLKPD